MRDCLRGRELYAAVRKVVAQHLDPHTHSAWIVGSEATGRADPGADIDVAIQGPVPVALDRLARLRVDLEELPTLRSFDVVDLGRVSERFRREALRTAIPLTGDRRS
jgi:predicted nucleotidyltransferase